MKSSYLQQSRYLYPSISTPTVKTMATGPGLNPTMCKQLMDGSKYQGKKRVNFKSHKNVASRWSMDKT